MNSYARSKTMGNKQPVIVDGDNVCYASLSADGKPMLQNLLSCIQKLNKNDKIDLISVFISPKLRYAIDYPDALENLLNDGEITQTPAEAPLEYFIIETAVGAETGLQDHRKFFIAPDRTASALCDARKPF